LGELETSCVDPRGKALSDRQRSKREYGDAREGTPLTRFADRCTFHQSPITGP
jgi:hypothetical protein